MTNFGDAGDESCCTTLQVAGGTFYRRYDTDAGHAPDGGPIDEADPATVSTFLLDKYDVTVGRFRRFVAAWTGGWLPSEGDGRHTYLNSDAGLVNAGADGGYEPGWNAAEWNNTTDVGPTDANLAQCDPEATWTAAVGRREKLPITCITWFEAYAFCIWDGGFLPSEAEWEYAAAGGSEQRLFPWGATWPDHQDDYAIYNCFYPGKGKYCLFSVDDIAPVGTPTKGVGRWGQLDLAGNVLQWTLDVDDNYTEPCVDCIYVGSGWEDHVAGGGCFSDYAVALTPSSVWSLPPDARVPGPGIRCARSPQ
jgi:formylglycine-generating enzyme required for sulfatase activity